MLMLAIALLFLAAGAGLVPRYMRRRPGIPPVCYDWAGVIAILAVLAAAYAALRNFGLETLVRRWDVFGVLGLVAVAEILYQRGRAGKLLLDLGPRPGRAGYLIVGGIMLLGSVYDLWRGDRDGPGEFCLALFFLANGIARCQLREAGILWKAGGLIRWPDLAGYLVGEDGRVRLSLRYSALRPKLRVPDECREEFFKLLEDRAQLSRD